MKCAICNKEIEVQHSGYDRGHNADPVKPDERCCEVCNWTVVIPARRSEMVYGPEKIT